MYPVWFGFSGEPWLIECFALKLVQNISYIGNLWVNGGFPDSSVGKESACNAGDPGSTPGPGRSSEEGINHTFLYSWASLVAQLVKNSPAMRETWVGSLGWEDSLEKGKATTHSSILAWRIPCIVHGVTKSQTQLSIFHFHFNNIPAGLTSIQHLENS